MVMLLYHVRFNERLRYGVSRKAALEYFRTAIHGCKVTGKRRAEAYFMLDLLQLRHILTRQHLKHTMRRRRSLIPSGLWP